MILYTLLWVLSPINIPNELNGWIKIETKNYNSKNIFDYLNGAGENYISYKFINLYVYLFKKGKNEIIVDLFEMKSPKHSFGLFTHLRGNGEEVFKIGDGAEVFGNYLIFWKGKCFVSISSKNKILKEEILSFAKDLEKNLKGEKFSAEILNYLNKENIKKMKYFFDINILNYYFYIANEDIFYFNKGTEGAFYPLKSGFVLLLLFKNKKIAENALMNLKEKYYIGDYKIKNTEDGKWSSYVLKENLLKIYLNFETKKELIEEMNENK